MHGSWTLYQLRPILRSWSYPLKEVLENMGQFTFKLVPPSKGQRLPDFGITSFLCFPFSQLLLIIFFLVHTSTYRTAKKREVKCNRSGRKLLMKGIFFEILKEINENVCSVPFLPALAPPPLIRRGGSGGGPTLEHLGTTDTLKIKEVAIKPLYKPPAGI